MPRCGGTSKGRISANNASRRVKAAVYFPAACGLIMMSPLLPEDLSRLTVSQRLDLIGRLWDSIPDDAGGPAMPDWHREELERRLAAADAIPEQGIPWEQVKASLRGQP